MHINITKTAEVLENKHYQKNNYKKMSQAEFSIYRALIRCYL